MHADLSIVHFPFYAQDVFRTVISLVVDKFCDFVSEST